VLVSVHRVCVSVIERVDGACVRARSVSEGVRVVGACVSEFGACVRECVGCVTVCCIVEKVHRVCVSVCDGEYGVCVRASSVSATAWWIVSQLAVASETPAAAVRHSRNTLRSAQGRQVTVLQRAMTSGTFQDPSPHPPFARCRRAGEDSHDAVVGRIRNACRSGLRRLLCVCVRVCRRVCCVCARQ
jgi:hypothetical protein